MTMMAETFLLQVLQNGFSSIRNQPSQLNDILDALNDNEILSASTYFSNPKNKITIAPGFPSEPAHLPFIGVTLADDNQITEQTGIGLNYYETTDASGNITQLRGTRFRGVIKGTIYSPNADVVVWLSVICKWAMLSQFDWLAENAGLNEIQIRMGDYEPQPGFLPIFTFARGVFLTAEYDSVFKEQPSRIQGSSATGSYSNFTL